MKGHDSKQHMGFSYLLIVMVIFSFSFNISHAQHRLNVAPGNISDTDKAEYLSDQFIVSFIPEYSDQIRTAALSNSVSTGISSVDEMNSRLNVQRIDPLYKNIDLNKSNAALVEEYGLLRTFVLNVPAGSNIEMIVEQYSKLKGVEYAEPNYLSSAFVVPNDPLYSSQWGLNNTGQAVPYGGGGPVGNAGADINIEPAWNLHTGDNSVILSILDTGVDYNHPEFSGRIVPGYDFINDDSDPMDDNGHGTSCAGIAAAGGNNGFGIAGVNWNCMIMPVKVLGSNGFGTYTAIANGIIWAADNGADVLSLSLGGSGYSLTLENAVNYAHSIGCVILASRGNNNSQTPLYPASLDNVISVGALSPCDERKSPSSCDGEWWWGSSYGSDLEIMAPGTRIHATDILGSGGYSAGDYTSTFNGTSAACPFAAGLAALIKSYVPRLSNNDIRAILKSSAVDLGSPGFDIHTGYGRINAYDALIMAPDYYPPQIALSVDNLDIFAELNGLGSKSFSIMNIGHPLAEELNWQIINDNEIQFRDSDGIGGIEFNWTDISSIGTALVLSDDASEQVLIGFSFPFYGDQKIDVRVSSNGYLTFGSSGSTFINSSIPNPNLPNDIICPFWDDLNPSVGGSIHYYSTGTEFIVQYTDVPRFGTTEPNTFQVILKPDGSILFQYLDMQGVVTSATVGIENSLGTDGFQVVFNSPYVQNELAVLLKPEPLCIEDIYFSVTSGQIPGAGSQDVGVNYDISGYPIGVYNCLYLITSNDFENPEILLPITIYIGTPVERTDDLISQVQQLQTAGVLNRGQANALISKLQAARKQIIRNKIIPATNQIEAFVNQVNAFISTGILNEEQGLGLIESAELIIFLLQNNALYKSGFADGEISSEVPAEFGLEQNFPNPFNPSTTIRYSLPQNAMVNLVVYDVLGKVVAELVNEDMPAGYHEAVFDGVNIASGIYFYRLSAGNFTQISKMIMIK